MNGAGPSAMVVEKDVVGPSAMVVESDSVGPSPMVTVVVLFFKYIYIFYNIHVISNTRQHE